MKAFIFDPLWDQLADDLLLAKLRASGIEIVVITDVKPLAETKPLYEGDEDRLLCINPDYVGWKLTNQDYESIPHLRGIMPISTGYEWIEQEAATRLSVPICNIRNFSTQAVAEWAVMMMLSLARQTPRLIKDDFPLDLDKDFMKYRGLQLKGKTAGIIGLGNIGKAIAESCAGLGMKVVYWSRSSSNDAYDKISLEKLMSTADVIFPTLAKNTDTSTLVRDEHLRSIKKTAILVDITHGLLNEELVLAMVRNGNLSGYGFEAEPRTFTNYDGNVWAAPAYAWTTYESMYNSEAKLVENIIAAAKDRFPNRVN